MISVKELEDRIQTLTQNLASNDLSSTDHKKARTRLNNSKTQLKRLQSKLKANGHLNGHANGNGLDTATKKKSRGRAGDLKTPRSQKNSKNSGLGSNFSAEKVEVMDKIASILGPAMEKIANVCGNDIGAGLNVHAVMVSGIRNLLGSDLARDILNRQTELIVSKN